MRPPPLWGAFLAQLANMRRIVNVTDIGIVNHNEPDNLATCEASFRATAYMMNPAGPQPAEVEGEES